MTLGTSRTVLALRQGEVSKLLCLRCAAEWSHLEEFQLSSPNADTDTEGFPLPWFTWILLLPLGGLKSFSDNKKPQTHFISQSLFFFTRECMKASPPSPFPPVKRSKVQCGAASIEFFFPLEEILFANKSPSSKAHDGCTACNNFTLFLLFPQGLALHKVTYSYWSLWALNKQNTVDLTSWGVYFQ